MARRLRMTVYATDDNDVVHCFTPNDTVPEWVVDKIANDDAWADDEAAQAQPVVPATAGGNESPPAADPDALPPKSGTGSGTDAWIEWARAHGIEVDDDAPRGDVIEAVEAWLDEQPKS